MVLSNMFIGTGKVLRLLLPPYHDRTVPRDSVPLLNPLPPSNLWALLSKGFTPKHPPSSSYLKTFCPSSKTVGPGILNIETYFLMTVTSVGTGLRGTYRDMSEVKRTHFK